MILFCRARPTIVALIAIAVMAALQAALGGATFPINRGFDQTVPWSIIVPVVDAVVIGFAAYSAAPALEASSARPVRLLRPLPLVVLLVLAAALGVLTTASLAGPYTWIAAARNTAGLTGITLLASTVVPSGLVWLPTVTFAALAVTVGGHAGVISTWAWPVQPNDDASALLIAGCLTLIGFLALTAFGPRQAR